MLVHCYTVCFDRYKSLADLFKAILLIINKDFPFFTYEDLLDKMNELRIVTDYYSREDKEVHLQIWFPETDSEYAARIKKEEESIKLFQQQVKMDNHTRYEDRKRRKKLQDVLKQKLTQEELAQITIK